MQKIRKKTLALFLAALMVFTCAMPAWADEPEVNEPLEQTEEVVEEVPVASPSDAEKEEPELPAEMSLAMAPLLGSGSSSIGNLWNGWDEYADNMYKPLGAGTKADPYLLTDLANLMWLTVNVAKGTSGVATAEYILTNDIDMAGLPCDHWNPIGWYKNDTDPTAVKPFKGHFDGCGYTVTGLDLIDTAKELKYLGLFGVIEDGVVENLTVEADTVAGYDYVGILAGKMTGKAEAHRVTVIGTANAGISVSTSSDTACVGGITGLAEGSALDASNSVVIEDCKAMNVTLNAAGAGSMVGSIVGAANKAYIVDSYVDGSVVKGQGYVGGVAGQQTKTNIYNSFIDITVGCSGSVAAGGVTGHFVSGEIFLVQFDGEIAATNRAVTHEGLAIGTRGTTTSFDYGSSAGDECGYVFFNESLKGKAVSGSGITGDATGFTKAANIGYWTSNELKYTLMEGSKEYPCGDTDYYYEELENAVRFIVVQKLGKQFSVQDYANGLRFSLNHYAAGPSGAPVLGYLVSIPQINSSNSADLDVAYLTALAGDGSLFYKAIDKTSAAAVAPGVTITVVTSAKNDPANNRYFQRVVDELVDPEKVKRPTYTDSTSGTTEIYDMDYQSGGTYTFLMPECDTEINCVYEKVHSAIELDPEETVINITATRTGDRKNPQITWRITDDNGHLLADDIVRNKKETDATSVGFIQSDDDVNPISIKAVFNSVSEDNKVAWSVDDATLLNISATETGYTAKDAKVKPEVLSSANTWLYGIVSAAEAAQKTNNYVSAIDSTEYMKTAVLTATTDPAHSVDNVAAYARCDVTLSFKIVDQTTLWTEGVSLDKHALTVNVKRKISGSRRAPQESWEVTGLQSLKATITPAEADVRSVTWEMTGDAATSLTKTASGTHNHDLSVVSVFNGTDISKLPDWMKELYDNDNTAKSTNKNVLMTGSGTKTATITVTATDKNYKVHTDTCTVTVNYTTVDTTPDVERLDINTDHLEFTVTRKLTGYRSNPTETYTLSGSQKLGVSLSNNASFLEDVIWTKDTSLVGTLEAAPTGSNKRENLVSFCINTADTSTLPAWIYSVISSDNATWQADKTKKREGKATITGKITAKSNDVTVPDGAAEFGICSVTVKFVTEDSTYTGSSYSGGGGGGGGGSSGATPSGGTGPTARPTNLPSYVVNGVWQLGGDGIWRFSSSSGHTYTNEWGAISNPYATGTQAAFDWFFFDANSRMVTGWFTDNATGLRYYLSPSKDGTQGHMVVGYQYIDGVWYYFHNISDGTRGHLLVGATTPNGEQTNAQGQILRGGAPVTDPAAFTATANTTASLVAAGVGK